MTDEDLSQDQPTLAIQRLPHGRDMPLPAYQSTHAAGMDLYAAIEEAVTLAPGAIEVIPCGFAMAVPVGYEAQVRPRSGLASRHGVTLPNAPGTIDADYRGEVKVAMINLGPAPFTIERAMRIAQLVIAPVSHATWREVEALPTTARNDGGFGHTGL